MEHPTEDDYLSGDLSGDAESFGDAARSNKHFCGNGKSPRIREAYGLGI
jgi:hypothetical protein